MKRNENWEYGLRSLMMRYPDFQDYKPRPIEKYLPRCTYMMYFWIEHLRYWDTASRESPHLYPWNEAGWFIALPYKEAVKPMESDAWSKLSFEEGWYWGLVGGEWVEVHFQEPVREFFYQTIRVDPRWVVPVSRDEVERLRAGILKMCEVVHE